MRNSPILTREQQRSKNRGLMIASYNLELELNLLVREILAGNTVKLPEFQQKIQFAAPETKERLLILIHKERD